MILRSTRPGRVLAPKWRDDNILSLGTSEGALAIVVGTATLMPLREHLFGLVMATCFLEVFNFGMKAIILTGLNLAHEMMHAWLRLNGYGKLDLRVEEGICVVLSYMWLDIEMRSGSDNNDVSSSSSSSPAPYRKGPRSQFERKFGEYCKLNLENQPYPIYADGFRFGHAAVIKYGLRSASSLLPRDARRGLLTSSPRG
ncbi:Protein DA1 [Platanthera zijinensis]|uniref:Protein DA1 n=1 Tax=Platanthera zijinensis TaxID=2320716 RepID=A0AAP0BZK5_9ASPA